MSNMSNNEPSDLLSADNTDGMVVIKLAPGEHGLSGLTMPPNATGRPVRPTVTAPQPSDEAPAPTDQK